MGSTLSQMKEAKPWQIGVGVVVIGVAAVAVVAATGIDQSQADQESKAYRARQAKASPSRKSTERTGNQVAKALANAKVVRLYNGKRGADDLEAMFQIFKRFATSKSSTQYGTLDKSEFTNMLEEAGFSNANKFISGLWRLIDVDNDDRCDFEELMVAMCSVMASDRAVRLRFMFEVYNRDSDNKMDVKEFSAMFADWPSPGESTDETTIRQKVALCIENMRHKQTGGMGGVRIVSSVSKEDFVSATFTTSANPVIEAEKQIEKKLKEFFRVEKV